MCVAERMAQFAGSLERADARGRSDLGGNASAPPRQSDRLLPRQEGLEDQRRVAPLITVAVDCMRGDHGARVTVAAALEVLPRHPEAAIVLVGLREALRLELTAPGLSYRPPLRVQAATELV